MGKDLKGKELGEGLSQRSDGRYTARYTNRLGKRVQIYGAKLQEVKKKLAEAKYEDEHGLVQAGDSMTVNAWYEYWFSNIKNDLRKNTKMSISDRYRINIKPYIGHMILSQVKPIHCQNALNHMPEHYKQGTIDRARAVMHELFEDAVEYDMILKNPVKKSVKRKSTVKSESKEALTLEEQRLFLQGATQTRYYNLFRFALQTGMRGGEITALKWEDVDFENRTVQVRRTMISDGSINPPKSRSGIREIPLTQEAIQALNDQRERNKRLRQISFEHRDFIFLSKVGTPINIRNVDVRLYHICDRCGIRHISLHILRHTFATRCIEGGMKPKVLQKILGHANINMTMNLYVHATEDEKAKEMREVEKSLMVI